MSVVPDHISLLLPSFATFLAIFNRPLEEYLYLAASEQLQDLLVTVHLQHGHTSLTPKKKYASEK